MSDETTMVTPIISAIEANQCIQTTAKNVRLLANKACVVRLFISMPSANKYRYVCGTLQIEQPANDQNYTVQSEPCFIQYTDPINIGVWRTRKLDNSLNFFIPTDMLKAGDAIFRLTKIKAIDHDDAYLWTNDVPTLSVKIHTTAPLRVRFLGISLAPEIFTYTGANFCQRFANTKSYLARIFPVSNVESTSAIVFKPPIISMSPDALTVSSSSSNDADLSANTADWEDDQWKQQINALHIQLLLMRYLDIDAGLDHRTHYHSILFSPIKPFHGRASGVPKHPDVSVVTAGPSVGLGVDRSGEHTAHELGHAFGLLHPGYCEDQEIEDSEAHDLYPRGLIATSTEDTVGLDVGDISVGKRPAVLNGKTTHDIMTYCDNVWICKRNYDHIHRRNMQEEHLVRPHNANFLLIVGQFDMVAKLGSFNGIHRLQNATLSNHKDTGRLAIKLTYSLHSSKIFYIAEKNPLAVGGDFSFGVFSMLIEDPGTLDGIELLLDHAPIAKLDALMGSYDQRQRIGLENAIFKIKTLTPHIDGEIISFSHWRVPSNSYFAVQIKTDQYSDWLTIGVYEHHIEDTLIDKRYAECANNRIRIILSNMNHSIVALDEALIITD